MYIYVYVYVYVYMVWCGIGRRYEYGTVVVLVGTSTLPVYINKSNPDLADTLVILSSRRDCVRTLRSSVIGFKSFLIALFVCLFVCLFCHNLKVFIGY